MRFIVLTFARSGSNFLLSLLDSHPNIKVFGELFNLNCLNKKVQTKVLEDPIKYLENLIYKNYPSLIKAIGFKIFYHHATAQQLYSNIYPDNNLIYAADDQKKIIQTFHEYVQKNFDLKNLEKKLKSVWDFLKNDTELKVIHLKRKNRLETFLSLRLAMMTNQWSKQGGMKGKVLNLMKIYQIIKRVKEWKNFKYDKTPIYLEYKDCLESFQKTMEWEKDYDNFFQNHNKIEIIYEDLCKNVDSEMKKIHRFLEIPHIKSKTCFEKQDDRPLSELISNYWDLKEKFKNTQMEEFFSE